MLYSNSYSSVNQYIYIVTIVIEVVYIVDGWKQRKKSLWWLYTATGGVFDGSGVDCLSFIIWCISLILAL